MMAELALDNLDWGDLDISKAQTVEICKAVRGEPYDMLVLREGYEKWEESLLTDAEIMLQVAEMKGHGVLSEEHAEDIRRRMDESVTMSAGLPANVFFEKLQTGECEADGCLPLGTPKPVDKQGRRVAVPPERVGMVGKK